MVTPKFWFIYIDDLGVVRILPVFVRQIENRLYPNIFLVTLLSFLLRSYLFRQDAL